MVSKDLLSRELTDAHHEIETCTITNYKLQITNYGNMSSLGVISPDAYATELYSSSWAQFATQKQGCVPFALLPSRNMFIATFYNDAAMTAAEIRVAPREGSHVTVAECLAAVKELSNSHAKLFAGPAGTYFCDSFKAYQVFATPTGLRTGCTSTYAFLDISPLICPCLVAAVGKTIYLEVDPTLAVCTTRDFFLQLAPMTTLYVTADLISAPVAVVTRCEVNSARRVIDGHRLIISSLDFCYAAGVLIELPDHWDLPVMVTLDVVLPNGHTMSIDAEGRAIQPYAIEGAGHGFVLDLGAAVEDNPRSTAMTKKCFLKEPSTLEDRYRDWFVHRRGMNGCRAERVKATLTFATPHDTSDISAFSLDFNVMRVRGHSEGVAFSR